ncbi:hypothetical protein HK099_006046 [Clydaea vesicula]|uniref:5-oxoprolinase n=1 Tax=Clydaea vesicula TaxID=447962 RepID=A0AAD5U8C6_9FUNG|nr:hypothetical protein HK099_006046 [Clydaea vesicula]
MPTNSNNDGLKIRVTIDRGGTFTDCIGFIPQEDGTSKTVVVKLLSVDPKNYPDAPREGRPHPRNEKLETKNLDLIRMGTTVATNSLLERTGEPFALLITKGFKDLLHIGNQARPKIFDLSIVTPEVLYDEVIEVTLVGYTSSFEGMNINEKCDSSIVKGVTGESVQIIKKPNFKQIESDLQKVFEKGIKSLAICLMHSFTFTDHEVALKNIALKVGFTNVTLSSELTPMIKIVPRGTSACVDAYLTPCIQKYIEGFFSGFDDGLTYGKNSFSNTVKVEFMQSDGGLTPVKKFSGFKAILSGPAAGVVGYALTSFDEVEGSSVIGFDMGGTSTDVSRYAGRYEHVFETTTAGITIQAPQLDIHTVAAGGGSRLFFKNGMFVVGPESASADPGPACYRKGGPLTITDANLLLGRLVIKHFPKIFGKNESESLDFEITKKHFESLRMEINSFLLKSNENARELSLDEIAFGFVKVANESMCRPIRALTQSKGHDTSAHILACFGGAGGQHACAIARSLGIKKILIHKYASILSSYGLSLADVINEVQEPCASIFNKENLEDLKVRSMKLKEKCLENLVNEGFKKEDCDLELYFNMRYNGTDTSMMTLQTAIDDWNFDLEFFKIYKAEFGFLLSGRSIIVDDIRVRGIGKSFGNIKTTVHQELKHLKKFPVTNRDSEEDVYWGEEFGRKLTPVYLLKNLQIGNEIAGPCLIIDATATIVVEPKCVAYITSEHVVIEIIELKEVKEAKMEKKADPIQLSIFSHRFMSIAEQMGKTLQQTSISTNIKERLDFSCALFGPDSGLVANAPHIPVHLGSMQEAVKFQSQLLKGNLFDGDVILTNHPHAGGSHLPDITVITPVFNEKEIVFFVASRGHHSDIGGITAGSMPPNSRELYQEGAAIKSFKLVENGEFNEEGITQLLLVEPGKFEGCSGTRCLKDNISDLKAQVAANYKGIQLVKGLISEYGLEVVQAYMHFIQENADFSVRQLLKQTARALNTNILSSEDFMDDGTKIQLKVTINVEDGSAIFDFEGTGEEVYGNINAPYSICYSSIIYCLRCLVGQDMPLNQGALKPITVLIPKNSLLDPSEGSAVVGGNVLTSQRLCDVILRAFQACGASQGCMNNLTFGVGGNDEQGKYREGFGYYETIAGGAGAGPTWHGRSGVHTHMTNTRITDPEIMERRYPVLLREFGLREGSGGKGLFNGGDGVIREIEFQMRMQVSILSERRVFSPYGMHGGSNGKPGKNYLIKRIIDENGNVKLKKLNFGGKNSTVVNEGDILRIETPGGGGFGKMNN